MKVFSVVVFVFWKETHCAKKSTKRSLVVMRDCRIFLGKMGGSKQGKLHRTFVRTAPPLRGMVSVRWHYWWLCGFTPHLARQPSWCPMMPVALDRKGCQVTHSTGHWGT